MAKGGQWEQAQRVFADMEVAGVQPNTYTYTSLIKAGSGSRLDGSRTCGALRGGQWERAQHMFDGMTAAGVKPDVITFSALISAMGKGGQWERAQHVFDGIAAAGVKPDVITYNALISAMESKVGQWRAVGTRASRCSIVW